MNYEQWPLPFLFCLYMSAALLIKLMLLLHAYEYNFCNNILWDNAYKLGYGVLNVCIHT